MTEYTITDLSTALSNKTPIKQWEDSIDLITDQREKIDTWLDNGCHAYGFSTFLGHLDNHPVTRKESVQLLQSHGEGTPEYVEPEMIRAITAVKLCQLSQGGSGISPETYLRLLESFGTEDDLRDDNGNILLNLISYGSGDVGPAASWVKTVLGKEPELERGDVIALINGNFVSTGIALHYWLKKSGLDLSRAMIKNAGTMISDHQQPGVQLPVSTRDLDILFRQIDNANTRIENAVLSAVSAPSANPMFVINDTVEPVSNSSFLNFDLSLALDQMMSVMVLTGSYLYSSVLQVSRIREETAGSPAESARYVQMPKVAKAQLDRLESLSMMTPGYIQAESYGVEDISDGALNRALTFAECNRVLKNMSSYFFTSGTVPFTFPGWG